MTGVMIELVCSYWLDLRLLIVIRFNTAIICDLQILKGVIIALLSFRKDELTEARTGKKNITKKQVKNVDLRSLQLVCSNGYIKDLYFFC